MTESSSAVADFCDSGGRRGFSAERLGFLADAGRILSSSLDYEAILQSVARLAVPTVADCCIVDLVERDGAIRRAATAHRHPSLEPTVAQLRRFPPVTSATRGVPAVLRSGQPEFVPEVGDALLMEATAGPEHLRLVQQLGVRSFVIVPLIARSRVAGALTLAYTDSGRQYYTADLSLATELANHAAVAIDNALLYREAKLQLTERQQARLELDRQHEFLRLLLEVTTAANEAPNLQEALRITLDRVRAHTGWPVGHAWILGPAGELVFSGLWSTDDPQRFRTLRQVSEKVRFVAGIGLPGHVLATGRALSVVDTDTDPNFLRSHFAPLEVKAAFAFPVRTGTEVVAVLEFFSARALEPDSEFLEVMEHVGTQLGRVVDRQRAAEALQQARERAEEAVRTRDDVLRMLSHDLRNPLGTMRLAAGLLRDDGLDERQRRVQLDVLHRAIGHMRRLVEGLLDLKRIEAGHSISVEPAPIEVKRLLDDGCRLFRPEAQAKRIRIVRAEPPHRAVVHADADRVLQVLWNLTGNAIKFTPPGGVVTLAVEPQPDAVVFSVTDTGPGISEENVPKLFDPYWQARRTARLGTGLGLPISKAIVEAHGGRIWVDSTPGRGTTVRFSLPHPSDKGESR